MPSCLGVLEIDRVDLAALLRADFAFPDFLLEIADRNNSNVAIETEQYRIEPAETSNNSRCNHAGSIWVV